MSTAKLSLIVLIVLIVPTLFISGVPLKFVPRVHATSRAITLYANYYGWNYSQSSGSNPTITVTQGDTISFNLINSDSLMHRLLIDLDGNGATNDCSGGQDKCSGNITPTMAGSIAPFIVTVGQGQYSYYCLYHSPYYMTGKLIVQAGPDYAVSSSPLESDYHSRDKFKLDSVYN